MPFNYSSISFTNINKDGTALSPVYTFTPAATPTSVTRFAIGNRVRIAVTITASGGSNWTNKDIRCNLSLYNRNLQLSAPDFGFETAAPVTGVATAGLFYGGGDGLQLTRQNIQAVTFQQTAPTTVVMTIDFYITCDIDNYINTSFFVNNQVRFLQSRLDNFSNPLQNFGDSVFSWLEAIGISTIIKPVSGTQEYVWNSTTLRNFWKIPFSARWYNSDFPTLTAGKYVVPTTNRRYMESVEVVCPSQVAAGLSSITDLNASTWLSPFDANIDTMFTGTANKLAYNETNTVSITLQGYSSGAFAVTTVNYIRVLLIRTDRFQNNLLFTDNYSMNEAVLPAVLVPVTQLDGAIYSPSSWIQNGITGEIDIQFDLNGSLLELGREYRIIINCYETANPDRPTAHITPPLYVQYVPPAVPTITGYLGTYSQEYTTNELEDVAPHNRIRARLEIDKASYAAALAAFGLVGTFDASLSEISATILSATGVNATTETYKPNTLPAPLNNGILTNNMAIITDDVNTFSPAAVFRIEEERAATTATIRWTLKMNQPNFVAGSFTVYEIQFDQIVHVNDFENDVLIPALVGIRFLDIDTYPAVKTDIIDICDKDKILVEVEKDSLILTGSVNFLATIYPADALGDTTNPQIEEEEDWQPLTPVLAQLSSGKLDAVDVSFVGDFATFEINAQQLTLLQQYFVTAISLGQVPDYCPLGLVQNVKISTVRYAIYPFWQIDDQTVNFINEILAHPDYIGGITIVYNRVVNNAGIMQGTHTYTTTVIANDTLVVDNIPVQPEVYVELRVDAVFNSGSGNHLVSHTLVHTVTLPNVGDPTLVVNTNSYVCNDLG